MTRKDYSAIADAIRTEVAGASIRAGQADDVRTARLDSLRIVASAIAVYCARDNARFLRDRFMVACGFGEVTR